jgi:DNA-binding transcriptional regulator GbsR (MarR family)
MTSKVNISHDTTNIDEHKKKTHYKDNKEKYMITCQICGLKYDRTNKSKHIKSNKHRIVELEQKLEKVNSLDDKLDDKLKKLSDLEQKIGNIEDFEKKINKLMELENKFKYIKQIIN